MDIVERSVFLLRSQPSAVWAVQAAGAAPLLLSTLYFVFDATSAGTDRSRLSTEALLCAVCYLWFSVCRARFAQMLAGALSGQPPDGWKRAFDPRTMVVQSLKLVAMPLACAAIFPLGWAVAFFRSSVVFAGRNSLARASKAAGVWQPQVWGVIATLLLMSVVVFLNTLLLLALLPLLVKMLTGVENAFTRLGFALNRTNFAIALGLTWLLIDPLYQAAFCVRAFLAESRETGRDLVLTLRHLAALAILAIAVMPQAQAQPAPRVSAQELDSSVGKVLEQREYAWHLPRAQTAEPPFYAHIVAMLAPVRSAVHRVVRWIGEWLERLFRGQQPDANGKPTPFPAVKWTVIALVALLIVGAGFAVVRLTRTRGAKQPLASAQAARPIRLEDAQISAVDLPEERWMELGRECLGRGDYRLALRAFYLANLSWLGRRELLTIAPFKSNRDYFRELRRRAPAEALQQAFSENIRVFERGWYGLHTVDAAQVDEFEKTFSRMRGYVDA